MEARLQSIPFDILYKMASEYFTVRSIVRLSRTCKSFFRQLNHNERLWEHLYRRNFSTRRLPPPTPNFTCPGEKSTIHWRMAYVYTTMHHGTAGDVWETEHYRYRRGDLQPDDLLYSASKSGHERLVECAIRRGACCFGSGLRLASWNGYLDIVDRMLEMGTSGYAPAIHSASYRGHLEIVKRLLSLDSGTLGDALVQASEGGQAIVVDYLITEGAGSIDPVFYRSAFCQAAKGGHREIIDILFKHDALRNLPRSGILETAIRLSKDYGHYDLATYLRDLLPQGHVLRRP